MGLFDKFTGAAKRKEFGERLATALGDSDEIIRVDFDEGTFTLVIEDVLGRRTLDLTIDFKAYDSAETPEAEDAALLEVGERQLRTYNRIPYDVEVANANLMPYLRERVYFEVRPMHIELSGGQAPTMRHAVVSEYLGVELAYNNEESGLRRVYDWHYAHWGIEFEDLLRTALANLKSKLLTKRWHSPEPRVYVSPWRTPFDSALMLFKEAIQELRVIGDHVVLAPTNDMLIVTGSKDMHGLGKMAELAEEIISESGRFLSTIPMVLKHDELHAFELPRSHALYRKYKIMQIENLMRDYTGQKEMLDAWFDHTGARTLVPEYTALENLSIRDIYSYCVWPNHSPALLLPRTDRIYFMDDPEVEEVSRVESWDRVMDVLGDVVERVGMNPERYRVVGYPSRMQFDAFRGEN